MPRGRRRSNLATLEQKLTKLDGERRAIIAAIKAAVEHLAHGTGISAGRAAGTGAAHAAPRAGRRRRRKVSAEVRARLSKLASERWAKAKKAGKTRLG